MRYERPDLAGWRRRAKLREGSRATAVSLKKHRKPKYVRKLYEED